MTLITFLASSGYKAHSLPQANWGSVSLQGMPSLALLVAREALQS